MKKVFVLDWYTSKNIEVEKMPAEDFDKLKVGDKIIYNTQDQT